VCKKCEICKSGKKQIVLATDGDKQYSRRIKGMTWLHAHFGVVFGHGFLLNMEPDQVYICVLHANLCIVGALFEHTVLKEVGKHCLSSEKDKVCEEIWSLLVKNHIPIKRITLPSNSIPDHYKSISKFSFFWQRLCYTVV
jgi:hypothetical protein